MKKKALVSALVGLFLFLSLAAATRHANSASASATGSTADDLRAQLVRERKMHSVLVHRLRKDIRHLRHGGFTPAQNRTIAQSIARNYYGWTGRQWAALDTLWGKRESGWRSNADNPTSTAYGIPQALPGSKMSANGADWLTNPATQIAWGLKYLRARYHDPVRALAHSTRLGWY